MSYRVKTVAQLTGIPRPTLVAWERRYDLLELRRSEAGYRIYEEADVAYLKELKSLVDQGVAISEAITRVPRPGPSPVSVVGAAVAAGAAPRDLVHALVDSLIAFDRLGMDEPTQKRVRALISQPQGFVVTCGPTGAGKTSTLYGLMQLVDTASTNVMTLEDPIEVELYTITQGQTNVRAGFTFAAGLRAILRQDPDVILVGEMRDGETAGIALQAALTGHLVMSTLHTSDTVETIVRIVDLGIESWIVANALSAIIAQRLVRVACRHCREPFKLEHDVWDGDEVLLVAGTETFTTRGCRECHNSGFKGRTGIFELLQIDDEIRDLIKAKSSVVEYREVMRRRNVATLRRVGVEKALAGITTVAEVTRVT